MKEKPLQGYNFAQHEQNGIDCQQGAPADGSYWFEKIPTDGIPYVPRPDGKGIRIDFFGYSNLSGLALEIKEAMSHRFKHTGDVHRNAHYIGIYILRQMHVKAKSNNEADKIITASNEKLNIASERELIRGRLRHFYDHLTSGVFTADEFNASVQTMLAAISSDETKTWFDEEIHKLYDAYEYNKSVNRNRMKDFRASENKKLIGYDGNHKNTDEEKW
jgi:hypothetical protein